MTPYYADEWLTVYGGDCRTVLAELPADSVDCVVTSPPYWGLRDYGTATWVGGDEGCDHLEIKGTTRGGPHSTLTGGQDTTAHQGAYRDSCGKCGATRVDSQLGLERTPEEYVANLVAVFAEVRRVLKPSGTCWLNLGDSYAAAVVPGQTTPAKSAKSDATSSLKPKDLVGIPWRVAFALQADGWFLRSDVIWSKPNPMPESVTDRPTKSHEYLFLLTKSARYYFDADAVREAHTRGYNGPGGGQRGQEVHGDGAHRSLVGNTLNPAGRNIRSVWTIATRPYPGAHFAVFPPELPERCIKAGSSEKGVCPECGAPWERVVERNPDANERNVRVITESSEGFASGAGHTAMSSSDRARKLDGKNYVHVRGATTGWSTTCQHTSSTIPAVILDPFAGSGTVGLVANRLSRRAILIDLNPEYLKQQMRRNAQTPLGLSA